MFVLENDVYLHCSVFNLRCFDCPASSDFESLWRLLVHPERLPLDLLYNMINHVRQRVASHVEVNSVFEERNMHAVLVWELEKRLKIVYPPSG